jgi:hypothetical protein
MNERLVVNVSRFPHETIDGETILIDAETGHLILLTGFAAVLWSHLVGSTSSEVLASAVDARFGTEAADATRSFIQERSSTGGVKHSGQGSGGTASDPASVVGTTISAARSCNRSTAALVTREYRVRLFSDFGRCFAVAYLVLTFQGSPSVLSAARNSKT